MKDYSHKDIIFLNNKPFNYDMPCAGFYICKVNAHIKQLFQDWYNVNIPFNDSNHPWEQNALWEIFRNYNVGIIDSWMFQEQKHQFLRHVSSFEKEDRIPYFKSFIKSKKILYEKNIKDIQTIEFDTNIM